MLMIAARTNPSLIAVAQEDFYRFSLKRQETTCYWKTYK
jgi:hypothetical protein